MSYHHNQTHTPPPNPQHIRLPSPPPTNERRNAQTMAYSVERRAPHKMNIPISAVHPEKYNAEAHTPLSRTPHQGSPKKEFAHSHTLTPFGGTTSTILSSGSHANLIPPAFEEQLVAMQCKINEYEGMITEYSKVMKKVEDYDHLIKKYVYFKDNVDKVLDENKRLTTLLADKNDEIEAMKKRNPPTGSGNNIGTGDTFNVSPHRRNEFLKMLLETEEKHLQNTTKASEFQMMSQQLDRVIKKSLDDRANFSSQLDTLKNQNTALLNEIARLSAQQASVSMPHHAEVELTELQSKVICLEKENEKLIEEVLSLQKRSILPPTSIAQQHSSPQHGPSFSSRLSRPEEGPNSLSRGQPSPSGRPGIVESLREDLRKVSQINVQLLKDMELKESKVKGLEAELQKKDKHIAELSTSAEEMNICLIDLEEIFHCARGNDLLARVKTSLAKIEDIEVLSRNFNALDVKLREEQAASVRMQANYEEEFIRLKKSAAEWETSAKKQKNENETLVTKIREVTEELRVFKHKGSQLENEMRRLKQEIATVTEENENLKRDLETRGTLPTQAATDMQELQLQMLVERIALEEDLSKAKLITGELEGKLIALAAENEDLRKSHGHRMNEIQSLKLAVSKLQGGQNALDSRGISFDQEITALEKQIEELREQLRKERGEKDILEILTTQLRQARNQLENEVTSITSAFEKKKREAEGQMKINDEARKQASVLQEELIKLETENTSLREQAKLLSRELQETSRHRDVVNSEVQNKINELDTLKNRYEIIMTSFSSGASGGGMKQPGSKHQK